MRGSHVENGSTIELLVLYSLDWLLLTMQTNIKKTLVIFIK
jgi:hypothetical protein